MGINAHNTAMHNVYAINLSQIVNISPAEPQVPVSHTKPSQKNFYLVNFS